MTTKVLAEIKRLNMEEGLCDAEISRRLGISTQVATHWRAKSGLAPGKKGKRNKKKRYAFYNKKTTQFVCEGTIQECAKALGLRESCMHSIISRAKSGTYKKYEIHEVGK